MKDTLVLAFILGAILLSYTAYQSRNRHAQENATVTEASHSQALSKDFQSSEARTKRKGAKHEGTTTRSNFVAKVPSEESAGNGAETSQFASIYSRSDQNESAVKKSVRAKKKRKFKAGIPVEDFVFSQSDRIGLSAVSADAPTGLRVYLGCMEWKKKNLQYTGDKGCNEIINSLAIQREENQRNRPY